ncbi:MAG: single-strand DNA-binding protein [Parcubacteria group bacterium Gr01-1014_73]|nr:MAG: single-strand DNA-binding protein [Parcubacteria group bacterium Gr01-1014_73]
MYINKAFIFGNLTRDPEVRALPSGAQVASFAVATNRVYKDKNGVQQKSVDYHNVVVFGKQADIAAQYLKKGRSVFVEGRIQTRSWDDKTSGQKKYRTEIVAERFQFGPRAGESNFVQSTDTAAPAGAVGKEVKKKEKDGEEEGGAIQYPEEEINADDIPF